MIDLKQIEKDVLKLWEEKNVYQRVKDRNRHKKGEKFYFLQGPPYTSGKLHIAHAWNNSLKDMILRYKRMNGFDVWDRAGYDMHGLPTELKVQEKLGLKTKDDVKDYGIGKFVEECMSFSHEYAGYMNEDLWKLGVWMDYKNAYKPIEKDYISGEWNLFKKAHEQGRLYKGKKVMHWDAQSETSLAKHELEYETINDTSVFLKFPKKDSPGEYFVIWTTTPWTIPLNLAIMVNPELDYVKTKVDDETWILAKDLAGVFVSGLLGKTPEIIETFKGSELEGQEYNHPLKEDMGNIYDSLKKEFPKVHTILLSKDYVDTSAGTGLVHCAPGCGPEDSEVGRRNGIEGYNTLNERGEFENTGKFTGWVAKEDDKKFVKHFEENGCLVAKTNIEHEYPHSWRSHKPVVFRTTEQWFLKTEDLVPKLLEFSNNVHWSPHKVKVSHDRWHENLRDNSVTRQRYWGCPVPIWVNEKNSADFIVIGSVEELEKLTEKTFDDKKLHRPWIDEVLIEKDGNTYRRIEDVADVWIDSGCSSWNSLYNDEELIKQWFPADLVLEATEMTRQWFSLLQICSAIKFNKTAFKNIFVHGMLLDIGGKKMSKSLGNIISPYEVIDKHSADTLRYYMCQVNAGDNINFSWDDIKVKQRNQIILGNIANYILDLENLEITEGESDIEEKWIISRYNSTLKKVTELFESYKLDQTIGEIEKLFMNLSREYIKLVRDKSHSNNSVVKTAKEVLVGVLKMFCTICPFQTDYLWQKMKQNEESVHLAEWPKYDKEKIDENLEKEFETMFGVIEKGLSQRDKVQIGLKWPLASATIVAPEELNEKMQEIIKSQLNVKGLIIKKGEGIAVELDTEMSIELEAEGFARDMSRRVQSERKKRGLQKSDKIELKIYVEEALKEQISPHIESIKDRTGSTKVESVDDKSEEMVIYKTRGKELAFSF